MTPRSAAGTSPKWTPWCSIPPPARWSSPIRPSWCARPSTRSWSTHAPARTRAIRRRWIFPSSRGSTISAPPASRFEDITTCSARTCTSTTPAGTRCCATGDGCRPFQTPSTSSTRASTPIGRRPRSAAPIHPATCGPTIAGRSSRPARRCWSTTPISSTTRSRSPPRPAIRRITAASTSARAASTRS